MCGWYIGCGTSLVSAEILPMFSRGCKLSYMYIKSNTYTKYIYYIPERDYPHTHTIKNDHHRFGRRFITSRVHKNTRTHKQIYNIENRFFV